MKRWMMFLLFIAVLAMAGAGCNKQPTAQERFSDYLALWNQQKFSKMYDYLSKEAKQSTTKQEFVSRYQKIYSDLGIKNLKISFKKAKEDKPDLTYMAKMNSIAGKIQFTSTAHMKKEDKNWYVDWNTTYIFPQLKAGDKISLSTTPPLRGKILDRNGKGLAVNGQAYEVGVVPEKMGGNKDAVVKQLANLLQMTPGQINQAINASWVKPEYFVPLKKVSLQDQERIAQLVKLAPVQTQKVEARVYPYQEAAAPLVGYVGPITADELAELKGKGYTSTDVIGKRGLEQVYDEPLKGHPGVKVSIQKADGTSEVLAEKPVENGKDVKLTIDANIQQKVFAGLKGEAGASAVMNPETGETLALVSSPAYDPNKAALGFSAAEWKALQKDKQQPLTTRFKQAYAPGSTMKPITASIGLAANKLDPAESLPISGLKWQKDKSWGKYYVTRVHAVGSVNLEKALVLSDNIYFAQAALKIGKTDFRDGLKKFGFGGKINYPFPLATSRYGDLASDISLADSGYGQGQMQMSIVHLMAAYTPFVNGGNMIKPLLLLNDPKSQVWKKQVLSSADATMISGILRKVVADPSGTAHAAEIPGYPLSGKTGTAEIKQKQGETGTENGWFVAYSPNLMVGMMVENVQKRGGSQIPVKLVKNIYMEIK